MSAVAEKTTKKKFNLLYVDDEKSNLSVFKIAFKKQFNIHTAVNGLEALKVLDKGDKEIHVLITDQRMPEMTGLELLEVVNEKYPHIIKLVISEYSNDQVIRDSMEKFGILCRIHKPWDWEFVKEQIDGALKEKYGEV